MPEFIPRANLHPELFQRKDIPSTGQMLADTISKMLGQYGEQQFDLKKKKQELDARKEMADYVQKAMSVRQKEENITQTVHKLLGEGYTTQQQQKLEGPLQQGQAGPLTLPAQPGDVRFGPEIYEAMGMQPNQPGVGLDFIPPKPKEKEMDPLTKQLKMLDIQIKQAKIKGDKGKGAPEAVNKLLRARGQLISQMNNAATDQAMKDTLSARVSQIDASLGSAGLPGFDDELSSDISDAKNAVRLGTLKPEKAQAMLQKKYPGLAPVFQSDKGWMDTLMEAIGGGEE